MNKINIEFEKEVSEEIAEYIVDCWCIFISEDLGLAMNEVSMIIE